MLATLIHLTPRPTVDEKPVKCSVEVCAYSTKRNILRVSCLPKPSSIAEERLSICFVASMSTKIRGKISISLFSQPQVLMLASNWQWKRLAMAFAIERQAVVWSRVRPFKYRPKHSFLYDKFMTSWKRKAPQCTKTWRICFIFSLFSPKHLVDNLINTWGLRDEILRFWDLVYRLTNSCLCTWAIECIFSWINWLNKFFITHIHTHTLAKQHMLSQRKWGLDSLSIVTTWLSCWIKPHKTGTVSVWLYFFLWVDTVTLPNKTGLPI